MSDKQTNGGPARQTKAGGKKALLFIALGVLILALVGGGVYAAGVLNRTPAAPPSSTGTPEPAEPEADAAQVLAGQLADESVTEVTLNENLALTEPLAVKGKKTLNGSGILSAREGADLSGGLLRLDSGAELTLSSGSLNCAGANGVYVPQGAVFTVAGGEILNGTDWNIYNEGDTEIRDGSVTFAVGDNIYSPGSLHISGGRVSDSGRHNVYLASGGLLDMTGGTLADSTQDNLFCEEGTKADLDGESVRLSNAIAYGIETEGELNIAQATLGRNMIANIRVGKAGTLELSGGYLSGSSGFGVRNKGKMTMTGGEINSNALSGIENLGQLEITGGTINFNTERAVTNKIGGKMTVRGRDVILSGSAYGIYNEEDAEVLLEDVSISNNGTSNIRNFGTVTVRRSELLNCGSNSVSNFRNGTITLENVSIAHTSTNHGIYNDRGTVNFTDLTVEDVSSRAIQNKGGVVTGTNLTADTCGGAVIGNNKPNDNSQGRMQIRNFTTRRPSSNNIYCENGTITVSGGSLAVAPKNSVRVMEGGVSLYGVYISGTTKPGSNASCDVYTSGGHTVLSGCTLANSASSALNNRGGEVSLYNVTIRDSQATAIYNRPDAASGRVGSIYGENVTVTGSATANVNNEAEGTLIHLVDSVLEASPKSNVIVTKGAIELENTQVLGTTGTEQKPNLFITKGAQATIRGDTVISGAFGKGVNNEGSFFMYGGSIENNRANAGPGLTNSGVACLYGGRIHGNESLTASGGGVINNTGAELTLAGTEISGNTAYTIGGGLALNEGSLCVMTSGTVKDNLAAGNDGKVGGGGVNIAGGAVFRFLGGSFSGNTAAGEGAVGGGIRASSPTSQLILGGKLKVAEDNSVYVHDQAVILLESKLTVDEPIRLERRSYAFGQPVLREAEGVSGLLAEAAGCFLLPEPWFIDESGDLGNSEISSGDYVARIYDPDNSQAQEGWVYYTSLASAVEAVPENGEATIEIVADIQQPGLVIVTGGRRITLTDDGTARRISRHESYTNGRLITVTGNASLTLASTGTDEEPKLIFQGGVAAANGQFITVGVNGSDENKENLLVIGSGVALRDNVSTSTYGGALAIYAGSVRMDGGIIENNVSGSGAGAVNIGNAGASMEMNGGFIRGNRTAESGSAGAVNVTAGTRFTMTGGEISGNWAGGHSGAVYVNSGGTMTMTGGLITGNTAGSFGGGITVNGSESSRGSLTVDGGRIVGNTAASGAQGVELYTGTAQVSLGGTAPVDHVNFNGESGSGLTLLESFAPETPIRLSVAAPTAGYRVLAEGSYSDEILASFLLDGDTFTLTRDGTLAVVEGSYAARIAGSGEQFATLQEALDKAQSGDTVELLANVELTAPLTLKGKALTLTTNGASWSIRRGSSTGRMIQITDDASLTLQGSGAGTLTLDGENKSTANGQLLMVGGSKGESAGTLVINEGVILENSLITGTGAALAVYKGTATMNGGEIRGNSTTSAAAGAVNIGNAGCLFILNGGTISGNSAKTHAGAVNVAAEAEFKMTGGAITGNSAGSYSGGVTVGKGASFTMTGGKITGNSAVTYGGGVTVNNGSMTMTGGEISGNSCPSGKGIELYTATSALTLGGKPSLDQICYTKAEYPGVVLNEDFAPETAIGLKFISPSETIHALAEGSYDADRLSRFTVENEGWVLTETGMLAQVQQAEGAVYLEETRQSFDDLPSALAAIQPGGSGTLVLYEDLSLAGPVSIGGKTVTLTTNGQAHSLKRGGATEYMLLVEDGGSLTVKGSGGGSLILDGENTPVANGHLIRVGVNNGTSGTLNIGGGAVLTNSSFSSGSGAALVVYTGTVTMNGGRISGNGNSSTAGGAINVAAGGRFILNSGVISGNSAKTNAGAVNVGGSFEMNGGEISGNSAGSAGGAVYLSSAGSRFTLNGGKITGNNAGTSGGAIHVNNGIATIAGGEISGNTAGTLGGGVNIAASGTVNMSTGQVSANTAGTYGGGLSVSGSFTLSGGQITGNDNTGYRGGGVNVGKGGKFTMSGGEISGNRTKTNGGGVSLQDGVTMTMTGGAVTGNSAEGGGDGIELHYANNVLALDGSVNVQQVYFYAASGSEIRPGENFRPAGAVLLGFRSPTEGYRVLAEGVYTPEQLALFTVQAEGYTLTESGVLAAAGAEPGPEAAAEAPAPATVETAAEAPAPAETAADGGTGEDSPAPAPAEESAEKEGEKNEP